MVWVARLDFLGQHIPSLSMNLMNDITIDKGIKERYPACKGFLSGCFFLGSMKSFTSADIYGDVNVLT